MYNKFLQLLVFAIPLLVLGQVASAQIEIRNIPHVSSIDSGSTANRILAAGDTIFLPFWDDFSFSGPNPDTTLWDQNNSRGVFINATFGNQPPSLGVASFDGVDASGIPYNTVEPSFGPTDALWSKAIDLEAVPAGKRSSVVFSFYWQMKGNSEAPETKDFLRLEFKDDQGDWDIIQEYEGIQENLHDEFMFESVALIEKYFHKGFQFRFSSEGNTAGPFDGWHIDYVYLNQDRILNQDIHVDRTVISLPTSIFNNYTMIPYDVFFDFTESEIFPIIQVETGSRDNKPHGGIYEYQLIDSYFYPGTDSIVYDTLHSGFEPSGLSFNPPNLKIDLIDPLDFSIFNQATKDSFNLKFEYIMTVKDSFFIKSVDAGVTTFLENDFYNYKLNDTVRRYHEIHNTLAYDDGVAEYAASLNSIGAQLAVQFNIPSQDTVTHVDICFPNFRPLPSGASTINIHILKDLSDDPSSVLATLESSKQDAFLLNQFSRYEFLTPAIVSENFMWSFNKTQRNLLVSDLTIILYWVRNSFGPITGMVGRKISR